MPSRKNTRIADEKAAERRKAAEKLNEVDVNTTRMPDTVYLGSIGSGWDKTYTKIKRGQR